MTNRKDYQKTYYKEHPAALQKQRYLRSSHYKHSIRPKLLSLFGNECEVCGRTTDLNVCHAEHPTDFDDYVENVESGRCFILCKSHHKKIDNLLRSLIKRKPELKAIESELFLRYIENAHWNYEKSMS